MFFSHVGPLGCGTVESSGAKQHTPSTAGEGAVDFMVGSG